MKISRSALLLLFLLGVSALIETRLAQDIIAEDIEDDDDFYEDDEVEDEEEEAYPAIAAVRKLHKKKLKGVATAAPPVMPIRLPLHPPTVQQVEVPDVRRVISCQPGFDLIGTECVTHEPVRADLICPPGHELRDEHCLLFARPRRDCPEGYQLSKDRCTAVDVMPVQYTCPDGSLDETGKGCRIVTAVGPRCPAGHDHEADACVQRFPPSDSCPEGYKSGHKGCIKIHTFDASPMCPENAEFDPSGKKCFKLIHKAPKCPHGFRMERESAKCVKKVKKIHAPCPPGFHSILHDHICEKNVEIPAKLSCPLDAQLDSRTGLCLSEYPEEYVCPEGFQHSRSNPDMCDQIVPEIGVCPLGTKAVGYGHSLRCQTVVEHPMIECCPTGFEQTHDGKCKRVEYFKSIPSCTDCVTVRTIPATFECPPNFISRGAACVLTHTEPCPLPLDCTFYQRMLSAAGGSLRSLNAVDATAVIPSECRQPEPKMCKRDEVIPAEVHCPDGSVYNGESCSERTQLNAEPRCNIGTLEPDTGRCVKVTIVPVKTECTSNSTRIGNRCVTYEDHAPEFSCPEGSIVDSATGSCVVRTPAILQTREPLRTSPISLCPIGTIQGETCCDIERIPRASVCPEGSVPAESKHGKSGHGYCLVYSELIVPAPMKKHVKPLYFCSDGSTAKHMKCHSHDRADPLQVCPPDTEMMDRTCVRRMASVSAHPLVTSAVAVPVCPAGSIVQGTKCVATREVEAHIVCPPGFRPMPDSRGVQKCAKTADLLSVCPPGTTETADGCLKRITTPPISTLVPISCEESECYNP